MVSIPRDIFRQAIVRGINRHPTISNDQIDRLMEIADTAESFGASFNNGCPADQAGLCANGISAAVMNFARVFDNYWLSYLQREGVPLDWYGMGARIGVSD